MKYIYALFLSLFCFILTARSGNYEPQGTTVKKSGCNVMLVIQIALDHDSTGDVANIQAALDGCFALECDLPCADGTTGRCKIITKTIVVAWSSLSNADKPKFHHITMLPGRGVSSVDDVGVPNSGNSSSGSWYRHEYSPKVYCHETLHLAGLDDHYRDCRTGRLGVDNCKDGDTCTTAQITAGACPPCKGYEDNIMARVRKPVDCNMDIVEVIRIANGINPTFICSDSCCEHRTAFRPRETSTSVIPVKPVIINELFFGFLLIREDNSNQPFNTYGGEFQFSHYISQYLALQADLGFTTGSDGGITYTRKLALFGVKLANAFKNAHTINPGGVDIDVHLLGGLSAITSKFGNYSNTANGFTGDLGIGGYMALNQDRTFGLGLNLDYLPSFSGMVKNNFKVNAGLKFGLRSKGSRGTKPAEKPIKRQRIN